MSYHQDDHQHSTSHFVASQADTYDTTPYSNRNLNDHSSFYFSVELPNEFYCDERSGIFKGHFKGRLARSLCIESNFLVFWCCWIIKVVWVQKPGDCRWNQLNYVSLILPSKFSTSVWRTKILKETTCLPRDRLNVDRHPQDAQEISLCCFAAHSAFVLCSAKRNDWR